MSASQLNDAQKRLMSCLAGWWDYYGMQEKYPRLKEGQPNPFIDPAGYKAYITDREAAFRAELKKQTDKR